MVIPVFNEAENVPTLVQRLRALRLGERVDDVEFIIVDDHSTDRTPALLRAACAEEPRLRYLRLASNCGSHVAILAGLQHAHGDCAVFLAGDLQDPPELIGELLDRWASGDHVVWAVRSERQGIGWVEQRLSNAFYWLLRHVGMIALPPQGSDFALLDRRVIDALLASVSANPSLAGDIARLGFRQGQAPYVKQPRLAGRSKWSLEKKLRAFADAFVAFSYVPLRFMAYFGMLCSLAGFVYAMVVVAVRLVSDQPITGWASLMVAVLLIGGVQMTMLGVLGEYLWRTLEAARRRPRFFIEESVRGEPPATVVRDMPVEQVTPAAAGRAGLGAGEWELQTEGRR